MKYALAVALVMLSVGPAFAQDGGGGEKAPPPLSWCEGAYDATVGTNFGLCPDSAPKVAANIQSPGGAGTGNAGSSGSAGETGPGTGTGHGK